MMHNYLFVCIIFSVFFIFILFLLHKKFSYNTNEILNFKKKELLIEKLSLRRQYYIGLMKKIDKVEITDEECNMYGLYKQGGELCYIYIYAILTENFLLMKDCELRLKELEINLT